MNKVIYIVLTETDSVLSRAIKTFTNDPFNHISIAFDAQLNEMYSFGRKEENNPWIGGFVQESRYSSLLQNANCAIFSYTVTEKQYRLLRMQINYFKKYGKNYRYNFLGLLFVLCRIRIKRKHAYFCSQFIEELFRKAKIETNLCPYFVRPIEFIELPRSQVLYIGNFSQYFVTYDQIKDRTGTVIGCR